MNDLQISKIIDDDIRKIKFDYREEYLKNFRNEYIISNKEFDKWADESEKQLHSRIFEILTNKHKRIFDLFNNDEIIVIFNNEDINILCEILKDNMIHCNPNEFQTNMWVRFNNHQTLEFANYGPLNKKCPAYSFEEFLKAINI